jgi:hypothetical protein
MCCSLYLIMSIGYLKLEQSALPVPEVNELVVGVSRKCEYPPYTYCLVHQDQECCVQVHVQATKEV